MNHLTFLSNFALIYSIPLFLLYGVYVVVFVFAFRVVSKKRSRSYEWNLALLAVLFVCVTAFLGLNAFMNICGAWHDRKLIFGVGSELPRTCRPYFPRETRPYQAITYTQYTFLVLCQLLADFTIFRRCYLVWEKRRSIIAVPSALFIASFALGMFTIISEGRRAATEAESKRPASSYAYGALTLVMNVLVTCLTAGRIYQVARTGVGSTRWRKRYSVLIAMILESGMIYSFTLTIFLIGIGVGGRVRHSDQGRIFYDIAGLIIFPAAVQSSGIAPTVLILRAHLAKVTTDMSSTGFTLTSKPIESRIVFESDGTRSTVIPSMEPIKEDGDQTQGSQIEEKIRSDSGVSC